jgi:hypothetical protein
MKKGFFAFLIIPIAVLVLFTGCPSGGSSFFRLFHAADGAGSVDAYVDGELKGTIAFKENSGYIQVDNGEHTVKITAAGDPSTVLFEGTETFDLDQSTGIPVATDAVGGYDITGTDFDLRATDGALLRFAHLDWEVNDVDIRVGAADGTLLFSVVEVGDITEYAEIDPGSYDLFAIANSGAVVLQLETVDVAEGDIITAIALYDTGAATNEVANLEIGAIFDNDDSIPFTSIAYTIVP